MATTSQLLKSISDSQMKTKIWQSNTQTKLEPLTSIPRIMENQEILFTWLNQKLNELVTLETTINSDTNTLREEVISKILELNDKLDNLGNSIPSECSFLLNEELKNINDQLKQQRTLIIEVNSQLSQKITNGSSSLIRNINTLQAAQLTNDKTSMEKLNVIIETTGKLAEAKDY
jgi:hypothetical protein